MFNYGARVRQRGCDRPSERGKIGLRGAGRGGWGVRARGKLEKFSKDCNNHAGLGFNARERIAHRASRIVLFLMGAGGAGRGGTRAIKMREIFISGSGGARQSCLASRKISI
jgi:hypothetical protein